MIKRLSFVLCFAVFFGVLVSSLQANSSRGHVAIAIALLIEMSEKPEKYKEIHTNTNKELKFKPEQRDKDGKYRVTPGSLTSAQLAFIYGSVAPDNMHGSKDAVTSWHYIDSKGRINAIFEKAEKNDDPNKKILDYAYAYGALTHVSSDLVIHPELPDVRKGVMDAVVHIMVESMIVDEELEKELLATGKVNSISEFGGILDRVVVHGLGTPKILQPIDIGNGGVPYDVHGENEKYYEDLHKCPVLVSGKPCGKPYRLTREMEKRLDDNRSRESKMMILLTNSYMVLYERLFEGLERALQDSDVVQAAINTKALLDLFGKIIGDEFDAFIKKEFPTVDSIIKYIDGVKNRFAVMKKKLVLAVYKKYKNGNIEWGLSHYLTKASAAVLAGKRGENVDLDDGESIKETVYEPDCEHGDSDDSGSGGGGTGTHFISLDDQSAEIYDTPNGKVIEYLAYGTPVTVEPRSDKKWAKITVEYGLLKGKTGWTLYNKRKELAMGTVLEDPIRDRPQVDGEGLIVATTGVWTEDPLSGAKMDTNLRLAKGTSVKLLADYVSDPKRPALKYVKIGFPRKKGEEKQTAYGWVQMHKILASGSGIQSDEDDMEITGAAADIDDLPPVEKEQPRKIPNITFTIAWDDKQGGLRITWAANTRIPKDVKPEVYFVDRAGQKVGETLNDGKLTIPAGTAAGAKSDPISISGKSLNELIVREELWQTVTHVAVSSRFTGQTEDVAKVEDVKVAYATDIEKKRQIVSPHSFNVIKEGLRVAGQKSTTITSTIRTPNKQAEAMFDFYLTSEPTVKEGIAKLRKEYSSNSAQVGVVDLFVKLAAECGNDKAEVKKRRTEITQTVAKKISDVTNVAKNLRVSRHCVTEEEYDKLNVVDVAYFSFKDTNRPLFIKQMKSYEKEGKLRQFLDETQTSGNPCLHVEIKQPEQ